MGVDVEEGLARRMARGDVHPETGMGIVDEWPEFANGAEGAGGAEEKWGSGSGVGNLGEKRQAKAEGVHVQGPMDAFITSTSCSIFSLGSWDWYVYDGWY